MKVKFIENRRNKRTRIWEQQRNKYNHYQIIIFQKNFLKNYQSKKLIKNYNKNHNNKKK